MTEIKIEICGSDLSSALLEDSDFLSCTEFDDAVKAVVEDEMDRKIERAVEQAVNDYDFRDIVPLNTIDEHSENISDLQSKTDYLECRINDTNDAIAVRDENYGGFIQEVENNFNAHGEQLVRLFKALESLEAENTVIRNENRKLKEYQVDLKKRIHNSRILKWLFRVGYFPV